MSAEEKIPDLNPTVRPTPLKGKKKLIADNLRKRGNLSWERRLNLTPTIKLKILFCNIR